MRLLLAACLLLLGVSLGACEENPRPASEQTQEAGTKHEPTSGFEAASKPIPFWFAPQPQTIQIVTEKKAENECRSPQHYAPGELLSIGWCELRTYPEAITAFGTLVLALGTFILAISTQIAANAAKVAAQHIPRVERAYIFGDVLFQEERDFVGIPLRSVTVCISNYGKTPGDVERIAFSFCDSLPVVPDYSGDLVIDDRLAPNAENRPTRVSRNVHNLPGNILYGRVYYRDIFGHPHSSGFVRIIANSQIMAVDRVPRAFRDYD